MLANDRGTPKMTDLTAELAALRADIHRQPAAPDSSPPSPPDSSGPGAELEAMLAELRDTLAEAGDETREAIADHPMMAIAGAFLLGIVVGRISGRA
jgi:hypothetical protein